MNNLSLKGIGAGLVAAFLLSIPLVLLFGYYASAIYNELAPGVNFANEEEAQDFVERFLRHPLTIAFFLLSPLIAVGIPGYIAALVANRAFVLNSLAIGAIVSLLCMAEWEIVAQFPYLFGLVTGLSLLVALGAGYLRKTQVAGRAG